MSKTPEYIKSLKSSPRVGDQVVFHRLTPASPQKTCDTAIPWHVDVKKVLQGIGIESLYSHQAEAIDIIRQGKNVVVSTPTASGKTLIYNLPVFEKIAENPDAKGLYLFPLKALAQDQLRVFREMAKFFPGKTPTAEIYDGDTSAWNRKKIRENPPNVILTNPEMLHLSMLPYHDKWAEVWQGLEFVVIDEVHTYRGVMGSHMAQVFRRLSRISTHYNASPVFIFSSATVANPGELASKLTNLEVEESLISGAPIGAKHLVFIDPLNGPAQTAILLLKAALHREMQTIVYTQSRKLTELIALWATNKSGKFADKISAYRAGFLPEERREIEGRLSRGELLAVISTSALELGIDIGDLDLCILVGYPGTIMSTLQRGGRVGRSGQESAIILIAGEDALDQYFMRNPEEFLNMDPEAAVINPYNIRIMAKHLVCAAAELPLKADEPLLEEKNAQKCIAQLESNGELLRGADGDRLFSSYKSPQRKVDLRGSGSRFTIIDSVSEKSKGEIDEFRAFRETHPGAVYLHRGDTFIVEKLDLIDRSVKVKRANVDFYTRVRANKNTEIIEVYDQGQVWGTTAFSGRLKVTDQVTGYEKWQIYNKKRLNIIDLDLPPQIFETEGVWFVIPLKVQALTEDNYFHFMGGIHAIEHAAIGIFPLLVLTDRNDLGGISNTFHPQTNTAAVFIYDAVPGGAGLSNQAFKKREHLLEYTLKVIKDCPCDTGCPGCVHSPKCGSGNRPIDKASAVYILEAIKNSPPMEKGDVEVVISKVQEDIPEVIEEAPTEEPGDPFEVGIDEDDIQNLEAKITMGKKLGADSKIDSNVKPAKSKSNIKAGKAEPGNKSAADVERLEKKIKKYKAEKEKKITKKTIGSHKNIPEPPPPVPSPAKLSHSELSQIHVPERYGVFDIETQRSAAEVGGWDKADLMGISCVVLYDSVEDRFTEYLDDEIEEFVNKLKTLDLVVGFNIKRFDYLVLKGYVDFDYKSLPTLDLLEKVHNRLGYRLSLDHLGKVTLNAPKTADGLQALKWWKQGKIKEIVEYCTADVAITRDIFLFGRHHGYLLFNNKAKQTVRVPVDW